MINSLGRAPVAAAARRHVRHRAGHRPPVRRGTAAAGRAGRPTHRTAHAAAAELSGLGCAVSEVDLDARDADLARGDDRAAFAGGDIDVAVVAFGLLGEPERAWTDPDHVLELAEVNYTAPVHLGVLLADRMRAQAHGRIVALSSVAGERVRRSNFVYGSTKAGLGRLLPRPGRGAAPFRRRVLVVRPGFVRSKMTAGLDDAPLAVYARTGRRGGGGRRRHRRELIWVPAPMRVVMSGPAPRAPSAVPPAADLSRPDGNHGSAGR